jgi:DNA-binding IclR family transcriptional regulator
VTPSFTELATGPLMAEELSERLELHPRGCRDFFDALVALRMLEREGDRYMTTVRRRTSSRAGTSSMTGASTRRSSPLALSSET